MKIYYWAGYSRVFDYENELYKFNRQIHINLL